MTEAEWLEASDPRGMLAFLQRSGRGNSRRLRLFACACVRRCWSDLADARGLKWVESTERFVDGLLDNEAFRAETAAAAVEIKSEMVGTFYAQPVPGAPPYVAVGSLVNIGDVVCIGEAMKVFHDMIAECAGIIVEVLFTNADFIDFNAVLFRIIPTAGVPAPGRKLADPVALVHDVFGNPFRAPNVDPRWRTADALALARAAYHERSLPDAMLDAVRLAVLGDALEEAGCNDRTILDHLRGPGPHVRGCWVVDAILARE